MSETQNSTDEDHGEYHQHRHRKRSSQSSHSNTEEIPTAKCKDNITYLIFTAMANVWNNTTIQLDQFLLTTGAYDVLDNFMRKLAQHPWLTLCLSACVLSIALPFTIFMIFAMITIIMTFTGFIIVEGTIITIASVLLFGFIGSVILIFLFFSCFIVAGYFGFIQIYDLFREFPNHLIHLRQRFVNTNFMANQKPSTD